MKLWRLDKNGDWDNDYAQIEDGTGKILPSDYYGWKVPKKYQNELSVDFVFNGDITSEEAIEQIELLVKLADNNKEISFIGWKPSMYMKTNLK